jgi:Transposase DDE domain
MSSCAKEGALLDRCVVLAITVCQQAVECCPRLGPGRKPDVPDWVIAVMVVVGVLHRKKSRQSQFLFWKSRESRFADWFPGQRLLSRSQFYTRASRLSLMLQAAIQQLGRHAVKRGWADAESVAFDKSLIAARGRKRSSRQRAVLRGVDRDAAWGYSEHDGWVFGYAYEVAVSAGKQGVEWPLLASFHPANCSEQKTCLTKLTQLPAITRHVLADAGYDSNVVGETVEWEADGRRTGRRFVCPEIPRPNVGRPRQPHSRETRQRRHHRRLRDARRRFTRSDRGQRLYRRRRITVEPFNSRFKHAFELQEQVWHHGLVNNRVTALAAILAYQLLLTYNHQRRRPHARIQYILDAL